MTGTEQLFELLYVLLDRKKSTAKELSRHFGVSVRTVYRWCNSLSLAGIPLYAARGKGGGIFVQEQYALNALVLTEDEKASVLSCVNAFKNLTGAEILSAGNVSAPVCSAAQKLKSLSRKNTDWVEVDFSPWNPLGRHIAGLFETVRDAIIGGKVIQIEYFSSSGKSGSRFVHPRKLLFRGQAWYVFGWCEQKQEMRFFKLSRIQKVSVTKRSCAPCTYDDSKLKERCDMSGSAVRTVSLALKVKAQAAWKIMDDFLIERKELLCDGNVFMTVRAADHEWLVPYLLSFGSSLEVISPARIRKQLAEEVQRMHEKMM